MSGHGTPIEAMKAANELKRSDRGRRGGVMEHKAYILRTCNADMSSRIVIAYVGEDGVKPNTAYRLRDGKLVEA